MLSTAPYPFAQARTFVFRTYYTVCRSLQATEVSQAIRAARKARKLRKKQAKDERLRNFYGWCEGCAAYGSIF